MQTILPSVITVNLYFYIIGYVLGAYIVRVNNIFYSHYIVPGLAMMCVVNNAYNNASYSFFNARYQRSIEEMLVSPISAITIIVGYVMGSCVRALIVCFIALLFLCSFSKISIHSFSITLSAVLLCAMLFSLLGITNALLAKNFDGITFIPNFILTPLIYLSGMFYPVNLFPGQSKYLLGLNPLVYIVNLFRTGILGIEETRIYSTFCFLLAAIVLLLLANNFIMNKGICNLK